MDSTLIYKGFWYLSEDKENGLLGTLEIINNKLYRLSVIFDTTSTISVKLQPFLTSFDNPIPVMYGIVKAAQSNEENYFSLFNCELEYCSQGNITEATFSSTLLIKNALVKKISDFKSDQILLRPQFIDEWVEEQSIKKVFDWNRKDFTVKMEYKQPDSITLYKDSEMHIYVSFRAHFFGPIHLKFELNQRALLVIKLNKPVSFAKSKLLIDKIRNWYTLAIGAPVLIEQIEAICSTKENKLLKNPRKNLEIYFSDNREFLNRKKLYKGSELIPFRFESVLNHSILKNWFANYELVEPSLRIFIDTVYNKHLYSQNQFLNYLFALEIYHKRKYPDLDKKDQEAISNKEKLAIDSVPLKHKEWFTSRLTKKKEKINLETRITLLFKNYSYLVKPLNIHTKRSIKKIVTTRHWLVHHSESKPENILLADDALDDTSQKMRIILQAIFLTEMGMSQEQIKENIRRPFNNNYFFRIK